MSGRPVLVRTALTAVVVWLLAGESPLGLGAGQEEVPAGSKLPEPHFFSLQAKKLPLGKVLEETLETARRIADNAPISVRQAKHAIHYGLQMDLASGMMLEIEAYNRMVPTEDRREGVLAFNEKRKPRFKGR